MALTRGWVRRLQRGAAEDLEGFQLADGSTYFYDPLETAKIMFMYAYDVQLGDADKWSEPPEIFTKLTKAKDPEAVLKRLEPGHPSAFVNPAELYDRDVLVNERRLVLLDVEPPEDLSQ